MLPRRDPLGLFLFCQSIGSGQPTGLLTALKSVTPITAQGSAANTGGSETGATSLGSVACHFFVGGYCFFARSIAVAPWGLLPRELQSQQPLKKLRYSQAGRTDTLVSVRECQPLNSYATAHKVVVDGS